MSVESEFAEAHHVAPDVLTESESRRVEPDFQRFLLFLRPSNRGLRRRMKLDVSSNFSRFRSGDCLIVDLVSPQPSIAIQPFRFGENERSVIGEEFIEKKKKIIMIFCN